LGVRKLQMFGSPTGPRPEEPL